MGTCPVWFVCACSLLLSRWSPAWPTLYSLLLLFALIDRLELGTGVLSAAPSSQLRAQCALRPPQGPAAVNGELRPAPPPTSQDSDPSHPEAGRRGCHWEGGHGGTGRTTAASCWGTVTPLLGDQTPVLGSLPDPDRGLRDRETGRGTLLGKTHDNTAALQLKMPSPSTPQLLLSQTGCSL